MICVVKMFAVTKQRLRIHKFHVRQRRSTLWRKLFNFSHSRLNNMSTKDHIKIRVQFDSQTKFVVPCSTEWTIQKLKEEIEQRYQKILKLQERVAITKLTVSNSFFDLT